MLTKGITLKVVEEWKVDSISVPSAGKTLHMGDPIQVDVKVSGADAGAARFNYVWVRDNDWSAGSWDSSINATGASTAETSWTFTPGRPGSYAVYINTIRADGTKTTSKAYNITVREDWTFDGFDLSAHTILLGESLEVTAKASGVDADFARFNYVWNYRGDWSEWSSVELETGAPTSNDTWTFTPKRAGTYEIYVDAVRTDGTRVTKASSVTVESSWAAEGLVLTSNGEPLQGGKVALGCAARGVLRYEGGEQPYRPHLQLRLAAWNVVGIGRVGFHRQPHRLQHQGRLVDVHAGKVRHLPALCRLRGCRRHQGDAFDHARSRSRLVIR